VSAMRRLAVLWLLCAGALWVPTGAVAQATITLAPMNVESFRVLQRVSRNAGWASTAYKNYLVGLFEGLLYSEGGSEGSAKLFCLPATVRDSGKLSDTFEWLENELTNVVAKAQPNAMVARIFVAHLSQNHPCPR
jgi:hypothetical protein